MIELRWKNKYINYTRLTWSGTHNQVSRLLSFEIPCNPYDKEFDNANIKLGDLIYLYDGKKQLFIGTVTKRDKSAEIGVATYEATDFMKHLLRSNGSYSFKNKTAEKITKTLCKKVGISTKSLAKTKVKIKKLIFEEKSIYDMILDAYRTAKATTGKVYMPVMNGNKLSVIEKGLDCGVTLTQGVSIINATYSDTTDNMVNRVVIYNDDNKKVGTVQSKKNVEKYGVFQETYTQEDGKDAKKEAKALLLGITKEASVEAIGNIDAVSGKSLKITDKATGLTGFFYIISDSHTFENGVHTMTLGLEWKNVMEGEEEAQKEEKKKKKGANGGVVKTPVTNGAKCYYLSNSTVYHATTSCSACKGKKDFKTSTVAEMKKILVTKGKNKGKRKYKACSKCWQT